MALFHCALFSVRLHGICNARGIVLSDCPQNMYDKNACFPFSMSLTIPSRAFEGVEQGSVSFADREDILRGFGKKKDIF